VEIKRFVYKDLQREIQEPEVLVLVGPRQVGKTTLMLQLEADARQAGLRTRFLDLEQPADLYSVTGDMATVLEKLAGDADLVFVDEFYYLEDAGRIFKAIFDRRSQRRVKIIASGSSSVEIHGHLRESLAGRRITYRIYPLTFDEYRCWESPHRPDLTTYLRFGGLPGLAKVTDETRKEQLLQDYMATYIFKDVKGLIREENIRAFNQLVYLLAQNQGQVVEASSLSRELGLSVPTVSGYLSVLDQTYVNFLVPSYHTNLANELKKSRKTYLYDLGVRNSILKDFRPAAEREDKGAIHESFVFLSLLPHLSPSTEIRFWRTKRKEEVDFVLVKDRQPFPIEVKSHLERPRIADGLAAFIRRYPAVSDSFTVSDRGFEPIRTGKTTHHFLAFEDLSAILGRLGGARLG